MVSGSLTSAEPVSLTLDVDAIVLGRGSGDNGIEAHEVVLVEPLRGGGT